MEHNSYITSQWINFYYFLGTLLYNKNALNVNKIISWFSNLNDVFEKRKYKVLNVEESIFMKLFEDDKTLSQRNSIILVNKYELRTYHYKWAVMSFNTRRTQYKRIYFIMPSSRIPLKTLAVTNVTIYNLKCALNINHLVILNVCFKVEECKDTFNPPEADRAVVSFMNNNLIFPAGTLTKMVSNFLQNPRYICPGELCCICLHRYLDQHQNGYLYFKIKQIDNKGSNSNFNMYALTEATSIYDEAIENYFFPTLEWELVDFNCLRSISTTLPLGLEKYYCDMLKWFYPFLINSINELKPIFILSGASGIGKCLILNAISKSLGIRYRRIDCNNIISNTVTQIKSNILNAFKEGKNSAPAILHFSNAELLLTENGGNNADQVIEAFIENLEKVNFREKLIIVFSCSKIESLGIKLNSLSLQSLQIANPNEQERKLMIRWLAHRFSILISEGIIAFAAAESKSFTLADLTKMLFLSNKRRIECKDSGNIEKKHIKWFLDDRREKNKIFEVEWEDVGGVDKLKREVLGSLMSSKLIPGLERRGLLLHGPPGTGKTLLAKAVASQCNRTFITVKGPELLNMYVGQSEANLRQVFTKARESSPSILFFDELDSLAPNRGNKSDSGGVMDRVVSQLLAEMDGLEHNDDVFILAATNRPDLIDPALLRPGRFDKMLYIGPCEDSELKVKVMKAITRKFILGDDVEISNLVTLLPNQITGASIYGICSSAWMEAAREIINDPEIPKDTKVVVKKHHFEKVL